MPLHKDTTPPTPDQYILSFVPEKVSRLFEPLLLKRAGNLAVASFTDNGEKLGGRFPHQMSAEIHRALYDERAVGLITSLGLVDSLDPRDRSASLWPLATELSKDASHRSLPQIVFVNREKMGIPYEEHLRRTRRGMYNIFPADQSSVVLPMPLPHETEGGVSWPGLTAFEVWLERVQASVDLPATTDVL